MSDAATTAARRSRTWIPPALAALVFALLSLAILPYPGLQDDEVLFTAPLYLPDGTLSSLKAFGLTVPLMLTGYSGTLKTWLYATIFEFLLPSRWSVRAPMVLVGVITICLTWAWIRRIAGTRAAAFTVAFLSTDAVFIVTNTFDWGPVALQHALLMGGLLAVQVWVQNNSNRRGSNWPLALGFFLWGLGLWDKALLVWPLAGLAMATLCVYPKELRRHLRRVPLAIAASSLLLGALPLVCYNIRHRGETASTYTRLSLNQLPRKIPELQHTLDGSVLLGPIVATTPGPIDHAPANLTERLSVAAKRRFGDHSRNLMLPAIALSLACLLFLFRTPQFRLLAFIAIAATVAWLQMAINTGTGGGAHHVILLWPFPCIFVGVALGAIADRATRPISRALFGLVTLLVCANLLNTNEYLANLIQNGAVGGWTDAFYRLTRAIYPYRSRQLGIVDWGYLNGLRMMYDDDLKMTEVTGDSGQVLSMIGSPDFVFIQHTDDNQLFPGVNDKLRTVALTQGFAEQVERTVHDNQGRPVFEIFRFVKPTSAAAP
jgi:hypothetical protein